MSICKTCALIRIQETGRIRRRKDKIIALTKYGSNPPKCECPGCNETRVEFLQLDHFDGDGRQHRAKLKKMGHLDFYRWLKRENYPKLHLRVLCANCNASIGLYGYCPHQREAKLPI